MDRGAVENAHKSHDHGQQDDFQEHGRILLLRFRGGEGGRLDSEETGCDHRGHGSQDRRNQSCVKYGPHAGHFNGEYRGSERRAQQGAERSAHTAHDGHLLFILIQVETPPQKGADPASELKGGALPSGRSLADMSQEGRNEDKRGGAEPGSGFSPGGLQNRIGSFVVQIIADLIQENDQDSPTSSSVSTVNPLLRLFLQFYLELCFSLARFLTRNAFVPLGEERQFFSPVSFISCSHSRPPLFWSNSIPPN